MPQMSPMPWLLIFFNIITLMILISSFIYFFNLPQNKHQMIFNPSKTYTIKW